MPAGYRPVCYDAVHELGKAVDYAYEAEDHTETGIGNPILLSKRRHCEGEVLAHEIEQGIANHRADDDPPLPILE